MADTESTESKYILFPIDVDNRHMYTISLGSYKRKNFGETSWFIFDMTWTGLERKESLMLVDWREGRQKARMF